MKATALSHEPPPHPFQFFDRSPPQPFPRPDLFPFKRFSLAHRPPLPRPRPDSCLRHFPPPNLFLPIRANAQSPITSRQSPISTLYSPFPIPYSLFPILYSLLSTLFPPHPRSHLRRHRLPARSPAHPVRDVPIRPRIHDNGNNHWLFPHPTRRAIPPQRLPQQTP